MPQVRRRFCSVRAPPSPPPAFSAAPAIPPPGPAPFVPDPVIAFLCPSCRDTISVPREYAGTSGKCNRCGASVRVPDGTANYADPPTASTGSFAVAAATIASDAPSPLPLSQAGTLEFDADGRATNEPVPAVAPVAMGAIQFPCPFCRTMLESDRAVAGMPNTCPSCGNISIVPHPSTAGMGSVRQKVPTSTYVIGAVVVLAVASLVLWLALRDTGERQVVANANLSAEPAKERPEAERLDAERLAAERLAAERLAAERLEAEKKQHTDQTVATLNKMELEANTLIDNGDVEDVEKGIEKYQAALDLA